MRSRSLVILITIAAACEPRPQERTTANEGLKNPLPAPPERGPSEAAWVVSLAGAGAFRPGMSLEDARAAIPNFVAPATRSECDYANAGAPDNVTFLVVEDKVARIDVKTPGIPTDEGIRVGDSEDKVKAAYANVVVQPHKYTDGHYLIINNPSDTTVALIFETDGTAVTRYRFGTRPVVEWVEGCS